MDQLNQVQSKITHYAQLYQVYLDKSVPHVFERWTAFGVLLVLFLVRIILSEGWYIVCYTLGIYLLNLFLGFLQPKFDPSLEQEIRDADLEEGESLPTTEAGESRDQGSDEFRPFIRRLPEFKFWYYATRATTVALVATMFSLFDIPVFWPILLIYFIILFTLTMRRQIQHMIKYRYLPFDLGKVRYNRS